MLIKSNERSEDSYIGLDEFFLKLTWTHRAVSFFLFPDDTGAKSEEAQLSISGVNSVDRIDRKIDEDLTSQPEVSQKVQSDLDESLNENKGYEPNFDEESSNQEEESEVLREISIHDTYNGAIGLVIF